MERQQPLKWKIVDQMLPFGAITKKVALPAKQQLTMFQATGHCFLLFFDIVVPTQAHSMHWVGCHVQFG